MEKQKSSKTFSEIIQSDTLVLVDFSAEWCGPCKMMTPILKELKQVVGEQIIILKVDVDKNPAVAAHYQIQGIPTLIIFSQGNIKWRQSGIVPVKELRSLIDKVASFS
jgi:thioredoxin